MSPFEKIQPIKNRIQNEALGQSTSSVAFSFAFKKKLGKFFADCTNMQADIKSSAYKNNAESLMQAVKDYSTV